MLRAVLLGVLSLSAVACKSASDSPKSQPGVAAGKVIEVSGTVTVQHEGAARPLAKGDSIEGDDVVETGADGNVIVELAHNLARWELGPNKKSKVRDSVAWGLAKKSGDVGTVQQDTAAAGRPAERSAAGTSVSAAVETAAAPAAAPTAAVAPPAAQPEAAAAPPPPPPAQPPPRAVAPPKAKNAAPAKAAGDIGTLKRAGTGTVPGDGAGGAKDSASGGASDALDDKSGGGGAVLTRGASKASGADTAARGLVVEHQASIKSCLTKDAQEVSLRIVIGADGKATVVVKGKAEVPDSVKQCVTSAVDKIDFAQRAATVTIEIAR